MRATKNIYQNPTWMLGHFSFNLRARPVMVPPVPAPATTMSTWPEMSGKSERRSTSTSSTLRTALFNSRQRQPPPPPPYPRRPRESLLQCRHSAREDCQGWNTGPRCGSWEFPCATGWPHQYATLQTCWDANKKVSSKNRQRPRQRKMKGHTRGIKCSLCRSTHDFGAQSAQHVHLLLRHLQDTGKEEEEEERSFFKTCTASRPSIKEEINSFIIRTFSGMTMMQR